MIYFIKLPGAAQATDPQQVSSNFEDENSLVKPKSLNLILKSLLNKTFSNFKSLKYYTIK